MLLEQIALTFLPNIGNIRAKNLIAYCGSPEAVFREKKQNLLKIPGIGFIVAESISKKDEILKRAEQEIEFIEKHNIKVFYYLDNDYPYKLKQCEDSPVIIYYKGNADINAGKVLSIVGTRNATEYGRNLCKKIINELSDIDVLITSGLAYGIDICAHKESLQSGLKTVGILGHGLDRLYPAEHKQTAKMMVNQGGLLTSFPKGTKPDKMNFPARNAIIAGIADAVLVIESKIKGGALITAEIANSYSRDVFAVPGRINDKCSEGCNYLIKRNKAALIESTEDLKYFMNWDDDNKKAKPKQMSIFRELNENEKKIIGLLKENKESSVDFISMKVGLNSSIMAETLLNLELEGIIQSLPGKIYRILNYD